jgi:hypothetical protein
MRDYHLQAFRVLFLLKEGNDPEGDSVGDDGDLRGYGTEYFRGLTWNNITRALAMVLSDIDLTQSGAVNKEMQRSYLVRTAVVNIKKQPGGAIAKEREILAAALRDADLLKEQLALYKPHLTICGGDAVFHAVEKIYGLTGKDEEAYAAPEPGHYLCPFLRVPELGIVLDYYHPQCRGGPNRDYADRLGIILEAFRQHGDLAPEPNGMRIG